MADIKYRPELDGLRGIAVAAVVALHTWNVFPNAFIWVDLFFVLSGFFISAIIISAVAESHFSLKRFYVRRARRVLPLLTAVLLVCSSLAPFILPPELWLRFKHQLLSAIAFGMNFYAMAQGGMFDSQALRLPLIHLWSLAIEEQFYILWPIVLSFSARRGMTNGICVLGMLVSMVASAISMSDLNILFFSTWTRVWEFMAGAVVAQLWVTKLSHGGRIDGPSLGAQTFSSLAAIWLVWITFSPMSVHPERLVMGAVLSCCALIWFLPGTWVARLLSTSLLRNLGLISFSLYVWHWPILSFQSILFPDVSPLWKSALVVPMLVVSILSYRFVEMPFREVGPSSRGGRFSNCPVLLWPAILIAIAAVVVGFF